MRLRGGLILLRMGPMGNRFKEDTGPEICLGIKGVVYEAWR